MIFVTVGAQMPFDRLVRTVDAWAGSADRRDVIAQIGRTKYRPSHMDWIAFLDPSEFRRHLFEADLIVTHAGMGTILTGLEFGRRILVLPRRGDLMETRNDHQFGTTGAFVKTGRIAAAWNEEELLRALNDPDRIPVPKRIASHASLALLTTVRGFIRGGAVLPVAAPDVPAARLKHPAAVATRDAEAAGRKAA